MKLFAQSIMNNNIMKIFMQILIKITWKIILNKIHIETDKSFEIFKKYIITLYTM